MRQIKAITDDFFEGIPVSVHATEDEKLSSAYSALSDIISESLVVLNFQKRNILYVPQHYLCLCGYTPEKIKSEGYEFFKLSLHPDDLQLWMNIHIVILKSLYSNELPAEKINFFGCTLRIKSFLSEEGKKPEYLMVYVKIKPLLHQGIPVYGLCILSVAVVPKSGHLCVFYKNHDFSTYSFKSGKWTLHPFAPLSIREKQILVLSQQGLSNEIMAEKLFLSVKAIEKIKTSLFEEQNIVEELNLNSFSKKIQYANNRCLIYHAPAIKSKKVKNFKISQLPLK